MQSTDKNTRSPGSVNHPEAAAWMSFLYGEIAPDKKQELETHLSQCPACAAQVKAWGGSISMLNAWTLPIRRPARRGFAPALKWAVAAAFILALGVVLGRQTSSNNSEILALRASVADLRNQIKEQGKANLASSLAAARTEAQQQFAAFSRLQDVQRAEDRQALTLTLRDFDTRIDRVHGELETVALNTESGFEETHQVLASFTAPSSNGNN